MSRFSHLEFEERRREPAGVTQPGTPMRDALFFRDEAQRAWLNGDFELALRNYSRALEQDKLYFEGWAGQVRMLIELEEYEEALLWADKALELFPEHPQLLSAKAVACARSGDFVKAMAYTDNAMSRKGLAPHVWLARAEVLLERKSPAASNCLKNAISVAGPDAPRIQLEAGRLLLRFRQWPPAMECLHQAVKELPHSAMAWLSLGRCQAALGWPEARETLAQSLILRPAWVEADRALSAFENRGLFARVRGLFRRTVRT